MTESPLHKITKINPGYTEGRGTCCVPSHAPVFSHDGDTPCRSWCAKISRTVRTNGSHNQPQHAHIPARPSLVASQSDNCGRCSRRRRALNERDHLAVKHFTVSLLHAHWEGGFESAWLYFGPSFILSTCPFNHEVLVPHASFTEDTAR